jgi:hypothetical protein
VLTTLANLYHIYSNLNLEEDSDVCNQVLTSLEKRWAVADQDPFIAAIVLNPFLRGDFLGQHIALTPIGLCNMLKHLHARVFRVAIDADFQAVFMDYYNKRKEFSPEAMALADWADVAGKKVSCGVVLQNHCHCNIQQGQEANPVEIWEGIDTGKNSGRNHLTKLAIHILSVVTNSAGCERAFSHMGLVHTGIHSRLGVEKVCKMSMVGMDIKQIHLEAGLLRARGKQSFTQASRQEPGCELECKPSDININDSDLLNFNQLSKVLIARAASANDDKDVGNDDELTPPAPPLRITIPLTHQATQVKKTFIPLKNLFKYSTDKDPPPDGMNSFWKGGIQNLETKMEAYEILCSDSSKENHEGSSIEIPAMQVDID